jgi:hypothetical protein
LNADDWAEGEGKKERGEGIPLLGAGGAEEVVIVEKEVR